MEEFFQCNFEFYSWESISYLLLHTKLLHEIVAYRSFLLHLQSVSWWVSWNSCEGWVSLPRCWLSSQASS